MSSDFPRKPDWLKVRFAAGPNYARIDRYHKRDGLHTVCRSAACPNQGECWSRGTATFMILGDRCTRGCSFCNMTKAFPSPPDPEEPGKVGRAVAELALRHAVITSVTRDDLPDGGAGHFAATVDAIRRFAPGCRVELLIPDFGGKRDSLAVVLERRPEVLGHNLETVPRLYPDVRQGADYRRSLTLLTASRDLASGIPTKSGLLLGIGETVSELLAVLADLRLTGCTFLTLGQYLAPTRHHFPVHRFIPPEEFGRFRETAINMGFVQVEAGPLVRSSYHAEEQYAEAMNEG